MLSVEKNVLVLMVREEEAESKEVQRDLASLFRYPCFFLFVSRNKLAKVLVLRTTSQETQLTWTCA